MRIHKRDTGKSWSIDFTDHLGVTHTLAGFTDKGATVELSRNLRRLVQCREHQERPDQAVMLAMKTWPPRIRKQLLKWGIIDAHRDAEARPLSEHLDDFEKALLAKEATPTHASLVSGRARRVVKGCRFVKWSDIQPGRVTHWLKDQREERKQKDSNGNETVRRGVSAQTSNFYLAAIKQFCRWMVRDGRAAENPIEYLDGLNVRTDRRHDRRALTVDEARRLLATAKNGPDLEGMPGPERYVLYLVAMSTGLRRSELHSLTRSSFDLDADSPTVTVAAAYSKHRREDVQTLRTDVAALLAEHLKHKAPAARAFPNMPHHTARMLRGDLKAAGIAYRDDAGRVADFHALRHTFVTNLANSGVHPKVAQTLARHGSITLTMDRYSHTLREQETAAAAKLPDLLTNPQQQQATGTAGRDDGPKIVGRFVGDGADSPQTSMDSDEGNKATANELSAKENPVKNGVFGPTRGEAERAGFEPAEGGYTPFNGLANRSRPAAQPPAQPIAYVDNPDAAGGECRPSCRDATRIAEALSLLPEAERPAIVEHVHALAKLSPAERALVLRMTRSE